MNKAKRVLEKLNLTEAVISPEERQEIIKIAKSHKLWPPFEDDRTSCESTLLRNGPGIAIGPNGKFEFITGFSGSIGFKESRVYKEAFELAMKAYEKIQSTFPHLVG